MIQYKFDAEEHSITPAPHGNAQKPRPQTYIRTKDSTLRRLKNVSSIKGPKGAFHQVSEEKGGLLTAQAASDLPRNSMQASYYRRGVNRSGNHTDSLAILLEECKRQQMSLSEDPFIREVTGAPELRCVLAFNWQLEEIVQFCTNPEDFTVFTADPTFNLGNFNLTVTTYKNLKVVDRRQSQHPLMIGPLLLSQTKSYDSYNYFFGKLVGINKNVANILAIGTDGEEALFDGDKLWRPPSLLSEGFNILIWMASFTPLSYHLGSTSKISAVMMSTECPGSVTWMCLDTSDEDELGRLCSMKRALNERSVSPT